MAARVAPRGSQLIVTLPNGVPPRACDAIVERAGGYMHPLFSHSIDRLRFEAGESAKHGVELPDLTRFHRVRVPPHAQAAVRRRLRKAGVAAYLTPPSELTTSLTDLTPLEQEPKFPTPYFIDRQGYLDAAPVGVDARFAWGIDEGRGGGGDGVAIVDIEAAWRMTHEDLRQNHGGVIGVQARDRHLRNHGTAVAGIIGGDRNPTGVTGISPDAVFRAMFALNARGPDGPELAAAINRAATSLRPGDIILVELQHPGPPDFLPNIERRGYIPVEWWPENFAAIQAATRRGIIVVECAGNGEVNLGDTMYDEGDVFGDDWKNPFRHRSRDSGAIVVGAGAPPEEFVPRDLRRETGPPRSRLPFSNWGKRVDVQAWGRGVTTCGYGTLQGGRSENYWYTEQFGGTSSAAAIVAGALACVQGIRKRRGLAPLQPLEARRLLETTGTPQADGACETAKSRPIGPLPDLRRLIEAMPG